MTADPSSLAAEAERLQAEGRFAEAAEAWRRVTEAAPRAWAAHSNLGLALAELGRHGDAFAAHRRALELKPDEPWLHANLGSFFYDIRDLPAAAGCFQQAIRLAPGEVGFYQRLGTVLLEGGRTADAVGCFRHGLGLAPDHALLHFSLSQALLELGDFAHGFAEYEWRRPCHGVAPPEPGQPEWRGEPLEGRTLLLYGEQGLGDMLQFARFAALAAAAGGKVVLRVPAPLVRLLANTPGVARAVAYGEALPPYDLHLPLLSMARLAGLQPETIPTAPYLRPDPAEVERWAARLGPLPGLKVGLVWAGAPRAHDREALRMDRRRSLPLAAFAPLAGLDGVSLVSLQMGPPALQPRPPGLELVDFMDAVADFADTAALVANLDLVISADTAVAHLAGGMGKPVWVLSRSDACWRWPRGRTDSPWYPGARVFAQKLAGDWAGAVEEVAGALRALTPAPPPPPPRR